MNAVGLLNIGTTLGFTVALLAALAIPTGEGRRIERSAKAILVVALGVYALVGISNVLEHFEITAMLDTVEDYIEVLFFPLMAYVAYSVDANDRIAALTRAQRELQHERDLTNSVINASPAAIIMLNASGELRFASQHVRTQFGLGVGGRPITDDLWLRPYGRGAGEGPPQTVADIAAQAPFHDELFVIDRDGGDRIVSASAETTRAREDSETVIALVDVTERLLADEELEAYRRDLEGQVEQRTLELTQANEQLEMADSAKRDFLAKLSHELRTPLNSIIGFTGVLSRGMAGDVTPEQSTQLDMIDTSGKRLLNLVNDILDISKIETGQAAVTMRAVELHPIVACVVGERRALAAGRDIRLVLENDSTRPTVRTDPDKVEQIVSNLLGNALQFTPQGGTVTVGMTDVPDAVAITVRDTGSGMTPRERDHVFEPNSGVTGGSQDHRQGAGLALTIARELSDLIGARISVSSAPGEGTTFTLKIPLG